MDRRMDQALSERRRQEEASAVLMGLIDGVLYFASYLPGLIAVGAGAIFILRGELTAGFLLLSRRGKGSEGRVAHRNARGVYSAGGRERLREKHAAEAFDGRLPGL